MDPVTVSVTIARPREEVFEYLRDIANHAEFTDHFLVDWHLTRIDSYGEGAGARFKLKMRGNRYNWAEVWFAEVDAPYRIVEKGRAGKFNRVRTVGVYTLTPVGDTMTHVEFTSETEPATIADRILESFGVRSWVRRKNAKAMRRLRSILEEGIGRGERATVAGG